MVKGFWEFMSKESKARIIFIIAIVGVIMLITIPYLISVLSHRETNIGADLPDYTEITTDTTPQSEEIATEPKSDPEPETEPAPEPAAPEPTEAATYVAYTQSAPSATSQPVAQASTTPSEPVHRTTVDDNSSHDDGYTASGIDDPGSDDPTQPDDQSGEGGEV